MSSQENVYQSIDVRVMAPSDDTDGMQTEANWIGVGMFPVTQIPARNENVEIGIRVSDGERVTHDAVDSYGEWERADYVTGLVGEVVNVTTHYHHAYDRVEVSVKVDVVVEYLHPSLKPPTW